MVKSARDDVTAMIAAPRIDAICLEAGNEFDQLHPKGVAPHFQFDDVQSARTSLHLAYERLLDAEFLCQLHLRNASALAGKAQCGQKLRVAP